MVRPASLEVIWPDAACKLEPRVMQVLVALNRRHGDTLSREELSQLCWDGRVVGEDALVRCIVKLRKVFQHDPTIEIESIPRVGYRLRPVPVAPQSDQRPPLEKAISARRRPSRLLLVGGVLTLTVALGIGAAVALRKPPALVAEAVTPLTTELGVETHPALSPDGRLLVYAGGDGYGAPRDIFLRGLADGAPIRLTNTPQDESAPAWSPDGRRIAFVRRIPGAPCEILVAPIPQGEARVAGRCTMESMTRLAWTHDGDILLSDRPEREAVRRIRALTPDTGRMRDITTPPLASLGDTDPVVSHDGRRLAFRRTFAVGVDDLYAADVSGARPRALTQDGWKAVGFAFAADSRNLLFSSNRGGDFGLWSVSVDRPSRPARLSLGLLSFGRLSADAQSLLVAEAGDYRSNLFAWQAGTAPVAATSGNISDWDPHLSQTGQLTFISDQNGGSEVWIKRGDGAPARLTDLSASYVFSPRWSPDGRRIAFIAAQERRTHVYVINADGSGLRDIASDEAARGELAWDENGDILIPTLRDSGWRVEKIDAQGQVSAIPRSAGVRTIRSAGAGGLYAVKQDDDRLWRLEATGFALASPLIRINPEAAWTPTSTGVYHLTGTPGSEAVLRLTSWSGVGRDVQSLGRFGLKHSLAVSPDQDIVAARVVRDEADLFLIRLVRR